MKLYFYVLQKPWSSKPYVQFSECEVEEKPKTYKPIGLFPDGYYSLFFRKEDVGHLCGYGRNVLVLTEKNNVLAKEIFSNHFSSTIKKLQNEISEYQGLINAVSELED